MELAAHQWEFRCWINQGTLLSACYVGCKESGWSWLSVSCCADVINKYKYKYRARTELDFANCGGCFDTNTCAGRVRWTVSAVDL